MFWSAYTWIAHTVCMVKSWFGYWLYNAKCEPQIKHFNNDTTTYLIDLHFLESVEGGFLCVHFHALHYTGDSSVKHRYSEKATNFLKNLLLCFDITKWFPKKVYFFSNFMASSEYLNFQEDIRNYFSTTYAPVSESLLRSLCYWENFHRVLLVVALRASITL